MHKGFPLIVLITVIMIAMVVPTGYAYSTTYRHDRPLLEVKGKQVLQGILGPGFNVSVVGSEIYDGPTDRNLTFVYLNAHSANTSLQYDIVFWNDEPAMIFLVSSRISSNSPLINSIQDFAEKYISIMGRREYIQKYAPTRELQVSGSTDTITYRIKIPTPENPVYFDLLSITIKKGVPVKIFDQTYAKIPVNSSILTEKQVFAITDKLLLKAMKNLKINAEINNKKITYFIGLKNQDKFIYGLGAQVDYYFSKAEEGGIYGIRMTIDAITGKSYGWSLLGSFGLLPEIVKTTTNKGIYTSNINKGEYEFTINPTSQLVKSQIKVNYLDKSIHDNMNMSLNNKFLRNEPYTLAEITNWYALISIILLITLTTILIAIKKKNNSFMKHIFLAINIMGLFMTLGIFMSIPVTNASSSSILGSRYYVPSSEQYYDSLAASKIEQYSNSAVTCWSSYNTVYCVPRFDNVRNLYGSSTTSDNIYSSAEGFGEDLSVVFYIGHGDKLVLNDPQGTLYFWYITSDDGKMVLDQNIYSHSNEQPNVFVLLWSCEQGDVIGGTYFNGSGNELHYGMPYAWLHTTRLSKDGYNNPDSSGLAFIGFHGDAPFLTNTINNVSNAGYKFLISFYNGLMLKGFTIKDSLDFATYTTWGITSWNNIPITSMVVYGDSLIKIAQPPSSGFE